jgi:hypothetical protein
MQVGLLTKNQSSTTTRHEGAWEERSYSSYSFSTSALDRGEWSASRPGRPVEQGKGSPVPIVQEAGWAPEPVWEQRLTLGLLDNVAHYVEKGIVVF